MSIKIITDSTSDLPNDLADSLGVTIVPTNVIFGQEQFQDRVDLTPSQFYDASWTAPCIPPPPRPQSASSLRPTSLSAVMRTASSPSTFPPS